MKVRNTRRLVWLAIGWAAMVWISIGSALLLWALWSALTGQPLDETMHRAIRALVLFFIPGLILWLVWTMAGEVLDRRARRWNV